MTRAKGCRWPECTQAKAPGSGSHYCQSHGEQAASERLRGQKRRYQRNRWARTRETEEHVEMVSTEDAHGLAIKFLLRKA